MRSNNKITSCSTRLFYWIALSILFGCSFIFIGNAAAADHSIILEEKSLRENLTDYFDSWSKRDMDTYKMHFNPSARVTFIDRMGNLHSLFLDEFISSQKEAHRFASEPLFERPTQMDIDIRGQIATGVVRWELHKGSSIKTGTDVFTFIKTSEGWRILSLVWEAD